MEGWYWERCFRLAPDMEPEGSNKKQRMFEVEGQGGHGPKTGQSVIVAEEEFRQGDNFFFFNSCTMHLDTIRSFYLSN